MLLQSLSVDRIRGHLKTLREAILRLYTLAYVTPFRLYRVMVTLRVARSPALVVVLNIVCCIN